MVNRLGISCIIALCLGFTPAYAGDVTGVDGLSVSISNSPAISIADGGNVDGFSRLRVSSPFGVIDSKQLYNQNSSRTTEITNGVGAAITYLPNEAATSLSVGTVSGEYVIRQSGRYLSYVSGKSQLIFATGVLGAGVANVVKRVGYFDDNNGLFFQLSGTTLSVVRRSPTSGAVVDTVVNQADWNLDKLDGTGKSRINIDTSKTQIFIIDFQWLGVGRVRYGFDIDGQMVYVHELLNANNLMTVYMSSPSLPVRYEIRNVGASAGGTLKEICYSVASEGGFAPPGAEFAVARDANPVSVSTYRPVFAIRLKSSYNSKANRKSVRLLHADFFHTGNVDVLYSIVHINDPSGLTATWTSVNADSGVEYSADISAVTGAHVHTIINTYSSSGSASSGAPVVSSIESVNEHSYISQNYNSDNSQMFVIYAKALSGTASVYGGFEWIEFD